MNLGNSSPSANDQRFDSAPRALVISPRVDPANLAERTLLCVHNATFTVVDWEGVVDSVREVTPAAIFVPVPKSAEEKQVCRELLTQRRVTPVVGYADKFWERNLLLREAYADIAVDAAELSQLSLARLCGQAAFLRQLRAGETPGQPDVSGHGLRSSNMIGCLIASPNGSVQWANACIARWLGYPNPTYFVGVDFSRRHLKKISDWKDLAAANDNGKAYACSEISALDVDGRWAAFRIEAMTEPTYSGLLRLLLKNDTELKTYKAMTEVALQRDSERRKAVQ